MPSPQKVVAQALAAPQPTPTIEEPLSPQEVAHFKAHFRFLREHRNLLKLRVNAAEDLLLNGVREPSHRGLCNHLLAKVERARVLTVSQTMPPAEAVRFLSGLIRFAPEIGYILRFLECVKLTSSQAQAGAAVTEALKQLDFSELSAAQMRQLVALIVDVFAERELPVFLFSLLYDSSFRAAIDRSLDGFPDVLASMVRPLRAVHELVAVSKQRGRDRERPREIQVDSQAVKAGIVLLFEVSPMSLVELGDQTRRKLFQIACKVMRAGVTVRADCVEKVLASLTFTQPSERSLATAALVGALLASSQDAAAKKLVDRETKAEDTASPLARWRVALDAPRIGRVALDGRGTRETPPSNRWARGLHIPTQTMVLVRQGEPGEHELYNEHVSAWRRLLVPGVARVVDFSREGAKRPYLAVELPGQPWNRELQRASQLDESVRLRWAREVCLLLASLGHQGVLIPDVEPFRFNLDQENRLWLVDLWGLKSVPAASALEQHNVSARNLCARLLKVAPTYSVDGDVFNSIERSSDLTQLALLLEP